MRRFLWIFCLLAVWNRPAAAALAAGPSLPPAPPREFRAAWIATVGNSSWPSKPGLTTSQQKAELTAILDRAVALKLNAVIFQVRPACDALYQSDLEPWSEYLTGAMGRAPWPYYDPLAFAVTEAHKRGLELHAWFNPFRAHHFQAVSPISANHISKTHPEYVRSYGKYLWLDPGDPAVRAYTLKVVMDVVKRYDVDGVHFDDYFYPYHEKNSAGQDIDFPDNGTWRKYGTPNFSRDDWRRHNVDLFMEQVYHDIKAAKPWVKFGISPFGIWRPKYPATVTGFDSYAELYADSRKWLREGWCDYFAPQLYWSTSSKGQSFGALLGWWNSENVQHRHVWPGLNSLKASEGWPATEILNEISLTRKFPDAGHVHWSISALMKNPTLDASLAQAAYREPALIPASPWLNAKAPATPQFSVSLRNNSMRARWDNAVGEPAHWWLLQLRTNGSWTTQIFPASQSNLRLDDMSTDALALRAISRTGIASAPALWGRTNDFQKH